MDLDGDSLPRHVQGNMRNVTDPLFGSSLSSFLSQGIDRIFVPPYDLEHVSLNEMKSNYLKYGNVFTLGFLGAAVELARDMGD